MKPVITIEDGDGTTTLLVTAAIGVVERTATFVNNGTARHRRLKVLSTMGAVLYDRKDTIHTDKQEDIVKEAEAQDKVYNDIRGALGV